MNSDVLPVLVRRRVLKRLCGERVIQWVAETIDAPRMSVTGRSIRSVDAALRRKLVARELWSAERAAAVTFDFRPRGFSPGTDQALEILAKARADLASAQARFDLLLLENVRELVTSSPVLSVRDIAALLGATKSTVQRCAATIADRKPATTLRDEEKEASRGKAEPLDPTIPFYENPLASRAKARFDQVQRGIEREYPLPEYARRRKLMDADPANLTGLWPTKAAIAAARRERRRRRRGR